MGTAKEGGIRLLFGMVLAATCYNLNDLKTAECATACRREGYKGGQYVEKGDRCYCYDSFDYKNVTKQLLKMPTRSSTYEPPTYGPKREASKDSEGF
jgi:hypothetical protein